MTHLQMLAASARPISEVLIDTLRRQTNPLARLRSSSAKENAKDDSQPNLPLDDDADEPDHEDDTNPLRPDEVASAVLLGRIFDTRRDVLASLQNADSITVLEIPGEECVDVIDRILRRCVLGADANVLDGVSLDLSNNRAVAAGTVAIFGRRNEYKTKRSAAAAAEPTSAEFASAVQRGCAIIGIAAEPERLLPRDLVRLADHRIVVPPLDAAAVASVIAAITGKPPGSINEELGKRTTFEHLMVAVRADLGPTAVSSGCGGCATSRMPTRRRFCPAFMASGKRRIGASHLFTT
jgi:hypothetical protein